MNDLRDIFKFSAAERIQLAEDLWDSVAAQPEQLPPVSEAQKAEIERRLSAHKQNPTGSIEWNDVRARLWSRVE